MLITLPHPKLVDEITQEMAEAAMIELNSVMVKHGLICKRLEFCTLSHNNKRHSLMLHVDKPEEGDLPLKNSATYARITTNYD